MSIKQLCIFNPEHDLCLANGNRHYVPPASAVEFARRDADVMRVLYPGALCMSVYDPALSADMLLQCEHLTVWGWDAVVRYELARRGAPDSLLPTVEAVEAIRELQHRTTVLPLQPDCRAVASVEEMEGLLHDRQEWVMKAPWSGAGRGLHWVCDALSDHDRHWIENTVATQRCVIAEPWRKVNSNIALEYRIENSIKAVGTSKPIGTNDAVGTNGTVGTKITIDADEPIGTKDTIRFQGYSFFKTAHGVYRENVQWSDDKIAAHFGDTELQEVKVRVERWLADYIVGRYEGPLGVDLMVCDEGRVHVAEINFRHTMGMVAHERIKLNN